MPQSITKTKSSTRPNLQFKARYQADQQHHARW